MNEPPPTFAINPQTKADSDQLNLLSIFHFVLGGLSLAVIPFLALHFMIMQMVLNNPQLWRQSQPMPFSPTQLFHIIAWMEVLAGIFLLTSGTLNILSGFFIRQRKHRIFSLVVAGIDCLKFPLGTALGVFAMIVLLRESVQQEYEAKALDRV